MDIDRRTALAALLAAAGFPALDEAAGAAQAPAQGEPGEPDPSLYIPKAHLVEDRAFLHDFMDEYAFVDLGHPVADAAHHAHPDLPRSRRRALRHDLRPHLGAEPPA